MLRPAKLTVHITSCQALIALDCSRPLRHVFPSRARRTFRLPWHYWHIFGQERRLTSSARLPSSSTRTAVAHAIHSIVVMLPAASVSMWLPFPGLNRPSYGQFK